MWSNFIQKSDNNISGAEDGGNGGEDRRLKPEIHGSKITRIRSVQQRLPNGNTLITGSSGGRIFEVTRDGEIVWEFFNPRRAAGRDDLVGAVFGGTRYEPDYLK